MQPNQILQHQNQPGSSLMSMASGLVASLALMFTPMPAHAEPGDLDLSFDPGSSVDDAVLTTAVQNDGRVLIGGLFRSVHGALRTGLARLDADGSTDESFPGDLAGGSISVNDIILQPDQKILVGGSFTNINGLARGHLARLEADGSVDNSFLARLGDGTSVNVSKLALQSDGKIIVAGSFTSVNGVSRTGLARLNADGSLDPAFLDGMGGPAGATITSITIQTDGRIIVSGYFETFNGVARPYLVRLNADGSVDASFLNSLAGPDSVVRTVGLQPDGRLVIGGIFSAVNGTNQPGIARLHADGSLDETFDSQASSVYAGPFRIVVCPDNRILISGCLSWAGNSSLEGIVRLNPDGSRDNSFYGSLPADIMVGCRVMQLLDDGKILVAGGNRGLPVSPYWLRLHADGVIDRAFSNGPAGPNDDVRSIVLQPDGKLVVGGRFTTVDGANQRGIARLDAGGSWDPSYMTNQTGTDRDVRALVLQSDGKCLVGGGFNSINGSVRPALARLNTDGSVDNSFLAVLLGPAGSGYVYALALQNDGKVLIGGQFSAINGVVQTSLARLHQDGGLDTTFQAQVSGSFNAIHTMAVQNDGKILIGGYFDSVAGAARKNLARLNSDGSLDASFLNGMSGLSATPWSLAVQADGKVLVGGWFETINGVTRYGFARLNPDGSVDNSFQTGLQMNSTAWAIALQPDGKILVGGYLRISYAIHHLVRLHPNGLLDTSFGSVNRQLNGEVHALAVQPDSKIILAGEFTIVGQTPRSRVARLMGDSVAPTIVRAPVSFTAEADTATRLVVRVAGVPAPVCQWYFNGVALPGCTNATLELPNLQPAHMGAYAVAATNISGAVTSAPVWLSIIAPVERRSVPGLSLVGDLGSSLRIESTDPLNNAPTWTPLATVLLEDSPQRWFDLVSPLPAHRFYRTRQPGGSTIVPSLDLAFIPMLTLRGEIGTAIRVDAIKVYGPTDAWFTLGTVTLTNSSQLYFDVTAPGQPWRLYRLVPVL